MPRTTIDRLIINSPYEEPQRHWRYDRQTRLFDLVEGRRPAGYVVATPGSRSFDDRVAETREARETLAKYVRSRRSFFSVRFVRWECLRA